MSKIFDHDYFITRSDDTLGDAWGAVGAIGASAVQLLPALFGGGGGGAGGPARGLAAITAACQQAIQSLNQLVTAATSGQMPLAQAISEAERIAAALSNPQYIYQAQRGNDAAVLNDAKAQAQTIIGRLRSLAAPVAPPATGGGTISQTSGPGLPGGSAVVNPSPVSGSSGGGLSIDTSTLLIVGLGLGALFLLKG